MDIFKFVNPTSKTMMEQGEIINDLKSKMWIERYSEAGEFKFVANANSGLREKLSIGSFVSHVDSTDIMIVENHEIHDEKGKEPEIIISGRGFETYLENRIVGSNKFFPVSTGVSEYVLAANYTWIQIRDLIRNHTDAAYLIDTDNAIPYMEVVYSVPGTGISSQRGVRQGDLYSSIQELLNIDFLGIKTIRPGTWSPLSSGSPNLALLIYTGENRLNEIVYSYDSGEIESADYLWSNKKDKNFALISGRWVETIYWLGANEYDRRMIHVDASDIDNNLSAAPTGGALTAITNAMQERGLAALSANNDIALTKIDVAKNVSTRYRIDFNIGDLIGIRGNYNENGIGFVQEYVEIEDETGSYGYPTIQTF